MSHINVSMNEIITTNDMKGYSIIVHIDSVNIKKCRSTQGIVPNNNMSQIISTNMKCYSINRIIVIVNNMKCQVIKRFIVPNDNIKQCQYIKRYIVPNDTKNKLMQMILNTNNIEKRYIKRFIVPNNTKNKLISTNDKKGQPQQIVLQRLTPGEATTMRTSGRHAAVYLCNHWVGGVTRLYLLSV
ncbi:Hypothetical protein, putative [Bodo saltans]|uniref:Uncharacterized protein n=1 Tax=Bodo saltans TaxID=75058 RepID=A0A0S4J799_BODSA|nr:Hypothetical protein, putative [Bodo saltans]|eukprot:CUG86067.1 Hypothetical protein, putative [Bodo saltans]